MSLAVAGADKQRRVATLVLTAIGSEGFALAGASAIREHGITSRPTHDVDLFATPALDTNQFHNAVTTCIQALREHGYQVTPMRSFPLFARLQVIDSDDDALEVDLAVNWRAHPPVTLKIGPVLEESDAVADKIAALYSRSEVRDFLDLDSIRSSGRFSDEELLALASEHDAGFDITMFAQQLSRIVDIPASYAAQYGIDTDAYQDVQRRLYAWAQHLLTSPTPQDDRLGTGHPSYRGTSRPSTTRPAEPPHRGIDNDLRRQRPNDPNPPSL